MQKTINKKMKIDEILKIYPSAENIMFDQGLHCTHCQLASIENLEQGMKTHGIDDKQIDETVDQINEQYANYMKDIKKHGISITIPAQKELEHIIEEQKRNNEFLKIIPLKDEFGDYSYEMEFVKETDKDDQIIKINKLNIVIAKNNLEKVKGMEMDFIFNDFNEGFSIIRPKIV